MLKNHLFELFHINIFKSWALGKHSNRMRTCCSWIFCPFIWSPLVIRFDRFIFHLITRLFFLQIFCLFRILFSWWIQPATKFFSLQKPFLVWQLLDKMRGWCRYKKETKQTKDKMVKKTEKYEKERKEKAD